MKKFLFIALAVLSISAVCYASFPVSEQVSNSEVIVSSAEAAAPLAADIDWTLFIICWFAGALGIHRFIIGDVTNGILMLLTLGGCGIWVIIDLIKIAQGKMRM
ncbi:MAG: TM2 domain-containing protein [Bacteroidota bacterium]|nr:TM2 domain-containing protein [Bacteroidota bacterium]MEE3037736.1 TM2 domain-containing protein [Bacteroidota bacterium]